MPIVSKFHTTIVQFGVGDILLSNEEYHISNKSTLVCLYDIAQPGTIGRIAVAPEKNPEIILEFSHPDSIDILIKRLTEAKDVLIKKISV